MITQISEYIVFGDFNTRDEGWYLQNREAPTPDEREVVETIPYLQGELDFSAILGERVFEPREITYEFKLPNKEYSDRKIAERTIKSRITTKTVRQLHDSHDSRYYWLGKVKSVKVSDNPIKKHLVATIVFKCYPFAFHEDSFFDDVWDTFDFGNDFSTWTKWEVSDGMKIYFINAGDVSVNPTTICSDPIRIVSSDGHSFSLPKGESNDFSLILSPGITYFTVYGKGTISIHFNMEVMA